LAFANPLLAGAKEAARKIAIGYDAKNLPKKGKTKPRPRKQCRNCQQGLDVGETPPRGGRGKVFSLDIPFYRTRIRYRPAFVMDPHGLGYSQDEIAPLEIPEKPILPFVQALRSG
jgi:hypothetical protein